MSLLQLAFFVKYHVPQVLPLHLACHRLYEYRIDSVASFLYESCTNRDSRDSILSDVRCSVSREFESPVTCYIFYQKNLLPMRCLSIYDECKCTSSNTAHARWYCYGHTVLLQDIRTSTDSYDMARYRLSRSHDTSNRITHLSHYVQKNPSQYPPHRTHCKYSLYYNTSSLYGTLACELRGLYGWRTVGLLWAKLYGRSLSL